MRTSSSANRTCKACSSASEYTATVLMPSSRHAMIMRIAISPRFAIRIFLNIGFYGEEPFPVLHGLAVLDIHLDDLTVVLRVDLVHQLHRFDDAEHLAFFDGAAHVDERGRSRLGGAEERTDDRRLHDREVDVIGLRRRRAWHRFEWRRHRRSGYRLRHRRRLLNHRYREGPRRVHKRAFLDLDLEAFALELELAQLVLAYHLQNAIDLVKFHAFV